MVAQRTDGEVAPHVPAPARVLATSHACQDMHAKAIHSHLRRSHNIETFTCDDERPQEGMEMARTPCKKY